MNILDEKQITCQKNIFHERH